MFGYGYGYGYGRRTLAVAKRHAGMLPKQLPAPASSFPKTATFLTNNRHLRRGQDHGHLCQLRRDDAEEQTYEATLVSSSENNDIAVHESTRRV